MNDLKIAGVLDEDLAALFAEQLSGLEESCAIDLSEADLEDASVTAGLIDIIRTTARRISGLTLIGAPQVLAHGLYRIGAITDDCVTLVDPREEIGTSS